MAELPSATVKVNKDNDSVRITSWPKDQPLQLCVKLCEPICVDSDYTIDVTLWGRTFANARVKGRSRAFNCQDDVQQPH